ncbi:MAG: PP2C family protein-serine/threonine phosphatase [Acidobacteria bacterium]|nr:PP2C family protein-serine/threonine phosphatase [Acidobacteriota bacterium]
MKLERAGLLIAALAGFAAFALLYPKANASHAEETRWDRTEMHRIATEQVRRVLKLDISSWSWVYNSQTRDTLFLWQRRYARTPFDNLLSAQTLDLLYSGRDGRGDITVTFSQDSRVVAIRSTSRSRSRRRTEATEQSASENAKAAFAALAGPYAGRFPVTPEARGESEFQWLAPTESDPRVRWLISVRVDSAGAVRDAVIRPSFDEAVRREFHHTTRGMGEAKTIVGATIAFLGAPILGGMLIFGWMRRTLDRKLAWRAALLYLLPSIPVLLIEMRGLAPGAATKIVFGGLFLTGLGAFVYIGVGQRAAREFEWSRWRAFRLLLQWNFRALEVGRSVSQGLLWSGVLAVIPSAVVLSRLFPDSYLQTTAGWATRFSNAPGVNAFTPPFDLFPTFLLATLLPLVSQRFPARLVSLLVFVPAASLAVYFVAPVNAGPEGTTATSVLLVVSGVLVYLRYDLLAALSALKGCTALWTAASLLDGSAALHAHGFGVLAGLGLIWLAAWQVSRKGYEAEPEDPIAQSFLSQRERLKAEFSLAQQAQQRMLPSTPPSIPGFALAASCQPAKDVGGDLYDYFALPGGKTGLCVADVSGKGMPAALYMTLTKGLIAAASPESEDVTDLARKVNRHLHVACRKKVFVTAVLAAVDSETRTVDLIRAGHNPALLYEAAAGKARYLNPPGIGLGLAGPAMFDRGVKPGQVQLQPGDTLVLYSDGVTEAMNERLEQYGEERLQHVVERAARLDADAMLGEIKSDLGVFTGTEPSHDDATLLILQAK